MQLVFAESDDNDLEIQAKVAKSDILMWQGSLVSEFVEIFSSSHTSRPCTCMVKISIFSVMLTTVGERLKFALSHSWPWLNLVCIGTFMQTSAFRNGYLLRGMHEQLKSKWSVGNLGAFGYLDGSRSSGAMQLTPWLRPSATLGVPLSSGARW